MNAHRNATARIASRFCVALAALLLAESIEINLGQT